MIGSRMRWAELVASKRRGCNLYRQSSVGKDETDHTQNLRLHVWMDNTKMDLTETEWEGVTGYFSSGKGN
jgi:hypothetical protein